MKNTILTSALAVSIVMGGALGVSAQGHGGQHGQGPHHSFDEIDANGDGQITAEEMAAHRQARFEAMDTNGDGKVSADEMQARMQERMQDRVSRMMARADKDGDGGLSMEEMQGMRRGAMMDQADTDGDGMISQAEFDAMHQNMRGKMQGHGKGHGHMQDN